MEYLLNTKTLLFCHDIAVEKGGKETHEHHHAEARSFCAFGTTILRIENEHVTNNEQMHNAMMDHIREHINRPMELFTDILVTFMVLMPNQ